MFLCFSSPANDNGQRPFTVFFLLSKTKTRCPCAFKNTQLQASISFSLCIVSHRNLRCTKIIIVITNFQNRMHAYVKSQIVIKQSKCILCLFNIRALNQFTFLIKGLLQDEVFEFNNLHIQRNLLHRNLGYLYLIVRELYV